MIKILQGLTRLERSHKVQTGASELLHKWANFIEKIKSTLFENLP
jgi:hypothetical protein